jgi:hypothetical protein
VALQARYRTLAAFTSGAPARLSACGRSMPALVDFTDPFKRKNRLKAAYPNCYQFCYQYQPIQRDLA